MQSLRKERNVSCSADKLVSVLTLPEFEIEKQKRASGAIDATVKEIRRNDEECIYEVHSTEYAKGVTGVDRSKTESIVIRTRWNLRERHSEWTWEGPHGKKVAVSGTMHVKPIDDGHCTLLSTMDIEVKIPLVGSQVEKMVLREVEKNWPRFDELVDAYILK